MSERSATDPARQAQIISEFGERLDLLEQSGQVTNLARRLTELALADLSSEFSLTMNEENAAQFVTHLCIALTRINRGDPQITVSAVAVEEIADRQREHEAVARVMGECSRLLQREIPESEIAYMTVHLCGIVDVQSESDQ